MISKKLFCIKIIPVIILFRLLFISCTDLESGQVYTNKYRIISLSPHITEIIFALGEEHNLVAVTDYCNYPPAAQKIDKIGALMNPNIEKIVALKPTHIFGVPSYQKLNQELDKFGLNIIMQPNETILDIVQTIELVGKSIDKPDKTKNLISQITGQLNKVRKNANKLKSVSGMLVIGREKGAVRNISVSGSNTFIHELWLLAGGVNSFSDLSVRYGTVSLESIIDRNPEVIVEFDLNKSRNVARKNPGAEWGVLKAVVAVKNDQIFVVQGSHALIPGPRLGQLAMDFQKIIKIVQ